MVGIGFTVFDYWAFGPSKAVMTPVEMFLPLIPFVAVVAYYRSFAHRPVSTLELSPSSVALCVGGDVTRLDWADVQKVVITRECTGKRVEPFPAVVIHAGASRNQDLAFQPTGLPSPELLETCLLRLLEYAPATAVDVELTLLTGLAASVVSERQAGRNREIHSFSPIEPTVLQMRGCPDGTTFEITAPFEYFLGHLEKARDQCVAGLSIKPASWTLLVCQALCARALGDDVGWRASLSAATAASPPPAVVPALAHAMGQS